MSLSGPGRSKPSKGHGVTTGKSRDRLDTLRQRLPRTMIASSILVNALAIRFCSKRSLI